MSRKFEQRNKRNPGTEVCKNIYSAAADKEVVGKEGLEGSLAKLSWIILMGSIIAKLSGETLL